MPKESLGGSTNGKNWSVGLDVLVEGDVGVELRRDGPELVSQLSLLTFLIGVNDLDGGLATFSSKRRIIIHGSFRGGRRSGIQIRTRQRNRDEIPSVAFAIVELAMDNNILGTAKTMAGIVSPSASIMHLVDGF